MSTDSPAPNEDVQRWTVKRKAAVVLDVIKGKTTPVEVAQAAWAYRRRSRALAR